MIYFCLAEFVYELYELFYSNTYTTFIILYIGLYTGLPSSDIVFPSDIVYT